MLETEDKVANLMDKWGLQFARAFGEFVRVATYTPDSPGINKPPIDTQANNESKGHFAIQELTASSDRKLYERLVKVISEYAEKPVEFVEFSPTGPAKKAGSRLKQVFKVRGIKQADVARRLGVSPAVISRVLKHPERSRLQTIRSIADAAGVSLAELI
jgi:hypothetical protein